MSDIDRLERKIDEQCQLLATQSKKLAEQSEQLSAQSSQLLEVDEKVSQLKRHIIGGFDESGVNYQRGLTVRVSDIETREKLRIDQDEKRETRRSRLTAAAVGSSIVAACSADWKLITGGG
jgi:uncharacterized coiled-coil protein SlyX